MPRASEGSRTPARSNQNFDSDSIGVDCVEVTEQPERGLMDSLRWVGDWLRKIQRYGTRKIKVPLESIVTSFVRGGIAVVVARPPGQRTMTCVADPMRPITRTPPSCDQ
jgi:hypothetical protein